MIPKKPTAGAKPTGPKKRVITFKPDRDVEEFIDAMVEGGARQTDVIEESIRIARDLAAGLGLEAWAELEKQAKVKGVSEGAVLAEMLAPMFESTSPPPKKGGR